MTGTNEPQDAIIQYNGVYYFHRDWYNREFEKARSLQQQVNTLTRAMEEAKNEIGIWNIRMIINTALQSIKESPREEQTP